MNTKACNWNLTPRQAVALQRSLAQAVVEAPLDHDVRLVAGVDCAFVGTFRTAGRVLASAVLLDARTLEVVAHASADLECKFPYVPGLLSFREAPAVIEAVRLLPVRPDLLVCDGQGLAHPRGLGLASHLGLCLDVATIGAAKSRLCGQHRPVGPRRGNRASLKLDGRTIGVALRTQDNVRPMYVSVGHRITLAQAIRWVLRLSPRYRMPEPTRLAHQYVSRLKAAR